MKLKRKNSQGVWESVAPSQKEFDDFKNQSTTQLADKVGGQRKLKPEEFNDDALALITGNGTVNVLSIPQPESVTEETLDASLTSKIASISELINSVYNNLNKAISGSTTVEEEGLIRLSSVINNSEKEIDVVSINGAIQVQLLPEEYVANNVKYEGYQTFQLNDLNFDAATTTGQTADYARVQVSVGTAGLRTDTAKYNAIAESTKFLPEKQVNFNAVTTNYIGFHASGLIEFKVLQSDVVGAGFSWDAAGMRAYMKTLANFAIHIRKTSSSATSLNPVLIKSGDFTLTKKSTTVAELNFYTKDKKALSPTDTYDFKSYEALVENPLTVLYSNKPVRILASFANGECKNANCLVVKNAAGESIPFQWEDDRHVNYAVDKNMGRYPDGSLKDGYIWLIDTFNPTELKTYTVNVYEVEVRKEVPQVTSTASGSIVSIQSGDFAFNFNRANKFLLTEFKKGTVTTPFIQDPAIKTTVSTTAYLKDMASFQVKEFKVEGDGVIFKDFFVTLSNNDTLDVTMKTRIFKTGLLEEKQIARALRDIAGTELYGIHHRLNVTIGALAFTANRSKVMYGSWVDGSVKKSVNVLFAHGDLPRTTDYPEVPRFPVLAAMLENHPAAGTFKWVAGWEYSASSTLYPIPKGEVFATSFEINLSGYNDTPADEINRSFNGLVGRANAETRIKLKSDILKLISENLFNVNSHYEDTHLGQSIGYYYPSILGRLGMWKMYGFYSLDEVSSNFKTLINNKFGSGDVETMWTKYKESTFPLQLASRAFPTAEYLLKEFTAQENQNEITYYTDILKAYAEVLTRAIEETGSTSLYYNNGFNSNGTAGGLRGLAMGVKLDPTNARFKSAYDANLVNLKKFVAVENILTDGTNQVLPISHYMHYTLYTYYEYIKSTEHAGVSPFFNTIAYPFIGSSAYGALKEQEYCIASSRRGVGHSIAYMIYLLVKKNTPSALAQAKHMMERLVEQNKPTGGHEHPLEKWKANPEQSYDGTIPFELQVLTEVMYLLLDQKVRTNF